MLSVKGLAKANIVGMWKPALCQLANHDMLDPMAKQDSPSNKVDAATIEQYQDLLARDPKSLVFATLAEAYRERGLLDQAEKVASRGAAYHPEFAPGLCVWGRILLEKKDLINAQKLLERAVQVAPDHLLAYQLLGDLHLLCKRPDLALKAHKMALFLNPQNQKSQRVIEKLESLTATEYDTDSFSFRPLHQVAKEEALPSRGTEKLTRHLSLVDALIVRGENEKARRYLEAALREHPESRELLQRLEMLAPSQAEELRNGAPLSPLAPKERAAIARKIARLENLLQTLRQNPRS